MKFIRRIAVTASTLASNVPEFQWWDGSTIETLAAWSSTTNYSAGSKVVYQNNVYQAVLNHTGTTPPPLNPTHWVFLGATNRWAAFDDAVGSQTVVQGSTTNVLEFTLTPGQRFDSFGCLSMLGDELTVTVTDPSAGSPVYQSTITLVTDAEPVVDAWTYFFGDFTQQSEVIITDMPTAAYTNASIKITLKGFNSNPAKLGVFNYGMMFVVGDVEYGASAGITNYSTYDVDDFGVVRITPRSYAKRVNVRAIVPRARYGSVFKALTDYKDIPVISVVTDEPDLSVLTVYGHLREWGGEITYPTYTYFPIEIRGLT